MKKTPLPSGAVTVPLDELLVVLLCALDYDSRLPYGQAPEAIWTAITDEGRAWINDAVKRVADSDRTVRSYGDYLEKYQPELFRHMTDRAGTDSAWRRLLRAGRTR